MFGHDTSVPLCMWLQVNSLCAASLFRITGLKFESNSLKKKIRVRGALRQGGKRSEARASSIYTRKEKSTWPLSMQAVYTSKLMVLGLAWHPASNAIISVDDVLYTWQSYFSDNESTTWLWLVTRASRESIHVVALASRSSAQASEADAQVLER
jgi:hypothetical protein